ncbi:hypothetical protein NQ318_005159 [Aromia moschata]|uniref:Integrase catalytic domain-containing protein n=1 Tax=Aromia moschata TaxID=1265417 RepID=A0AAV8X094_9CUCU|nr:hypothetical protein NQ318_005159 [Aromia moschata]
MMNSEAFFDFKYVADRTLDTSKVQISKVRWIRITANNPGMTFTTKRAAEVVTELLKFFLEQGAPVILQSDHGREFTAEVIKEIVSLWPQCNIVHRRPRHPQSQGSVERSNQDVEQMLRIWMEENNSARWSVGCYFVQWQINTSFHRIIGRSPYKSQYGADPKIGLGSTNLPSKLIDKILTEEDLESINADENCNSVGTL